MAIVTSACSHRKTMIIDMSSPNTIPRATSTYSTIWNFGSGQLGFALLGQRGGLDNTPSTPENKHRQTLDKIMLIIQIHSDCHHRDHATIQPSRRHHHRHLHGLRHPHRPPHHHHHHHHFRRRLIMIQPSEQHNSQHFLMLLSSGPAPPASRRHTPAAAPAPSKNRWHCQRLPYTVKALNPKP